MKFKCKQDYLPEKKVNMIGFGAKPRTKIKGITQGVTYDGVIYPTHIEVVIYNDDKSWEYYQLNLFEPI